MASQPICSGLRIPCIQGTVDKSNHRRRVATEDNIRHQSAVAVTRDSEVVGHVPYNLAPSVSEARLQQSLRGSNWGQGEQRSWVRRFGGR